MAQRLKTIENELLAQEPIRMQGLLKKRKEPLNKFIEKFFTKWNKELNTVWANRNPTDDDFIQTKPDKKRSIGDIYSICRYYYPTCTLKEVKDIIYKESFDSIPRMRSCICATIEKRVFWQKQTDAGMQGHNHADNEDEYNYTVKNWKNATV